MHRKVHPDWCARLTQSTNDRMFQTLPIAIYSSLCAWDIDRSDRAVAAHFGNDAQTVQSSHINHDTKKAFDLWQNIKYPL